MQVSVVVTEPACVKVLAWPSDHPSAVTASDWVPTRVGTDSTNPVNVAKLWLPGRTGASGLQWRWQAYVALAGTDPHAPLQAAFGTDAIVRTIPYRPPPGSAEAFSFAASSCTQMPQPGQPTRQIVSARSMAALDLAFFVHMGDTSYVDTWKDYLQDTNAHLYTKFANGMRAHFLHPDMKALYDGVSMRGVMDDHEAGPDNCWGATVYPQARQVLTDVMAGTSYDEAQYDPLRPGAPSYDTWVVGQAQLWLLDNRLWRDPRGSQPQSFLGQGYESQLGATQRAWLKSTLAASAAPVKIVFSPRSITQQYLGAEQMELIDWITGLKSRAPQVSGKVFFLSGDIHAGAVWRLSPTHAVYEMLCGPMFNDKRHIPKALTKWQLDWGYRQLFLDTPDGVPGEIAECNAWGKVDVAADGSVALSLMRDTGAVLHRVTA